MISKFFKDRKKVYEERCIVLVVRVLNCKVVMFKGVLFVGNKKSGMICLIYGLNFFCIIIVERVYVK